MRQEILHYPRLDTVIMVESAIRDARSYPSKRQLWLSLRKKMMYQTFCVVLDYLLDSGKILIDKKGSVIWTHNPKLVRKMNVV